MVDPWLREKKFTRMCQPFCNTHFTIPVWNIKLYSCGKHFHAQERNCPWHQINLTTFSTLLQIFHLHWGELGDLLTSNVLNQSGSGSCPNQINQKYNWLWGNSFSILIVSQRLKFSNTDRPIAVALKLNKLSRNLTEKKSMLPTNWG